MSSLFEQVTDAQLCEKAGLLQRALDNYTDLCEAYFDADLVYAYAEANRLAHMDKFISKPNHANITEFADCCFEDKMYEPAKPYNNVTNLPRLAITLVHLGDYQGAVDGARKAKSTCTCKEACVVCLNLEELCLAQMCGLRVVVHADELQKMIAYYTVWDIINQLIFII